GDRRRGGTIRGQGRACRVVRGGAVSLARGAARLHSEGARQGRWLRATVVLRVSEPGAVALRPPSATAPGSDTRQPRTIETLPQISSKVMTRSRHPAYSRLAMKETAPRTFDPMKDGT